LRVDPSTERWAFAPTRAFAQAGTMDVVPSRRDSLLRTFAVLSLLTLAAITGAQVVVQWMLLRDDLLERERVHGANAIRIEAYAAIDRDDFVHWRAPGAP